MAKLDIHNEVGQRTGTTDPLSDSGNQSSLPTQDILLEQVSEQYNVRRDYEGIAELSANIKQYGLQQPVIVYPKPKEEGEGYILIDGHRRYRAYQELAEEEREQYQRIPCIVSNDRDILIRQLVSNIQRSDLSQTEIYRALMTLKEKECSTGQIAVIMGKDEKTVKNLFAAVKKITEDDFLKGYIADKGTIQEITEVLAIKDKDKRKALLEQRQNGTLANRKALRAEAMRVKQEARRQKKNERNKKAEGEGEENSANGILPESGTRKMTVTINGDPLRIVTVLTDRETLDIVIERLKEIAGQLGIAFEYGRETPNDDRLV